MVATRRVYADYASATPVHPKALAAAHKAASIFANPGGMHAEGVQAKRVLEQARENIAHELACKSRELVFTSGLTESNALAVVGTARALERVHRSLAGTHWLVSSIEHASVLESFAEVERMGGEVSYIEPEQSGVVRAERVAALLKKETVFVSVGWANNELGTVQPLSRIAQVIRAHERAHGTNVLFHADAGQAPVYLVPHVHTLGVDLFSLGSGKLYGPRGIGALYIGGKASVASLFFGGAQERGVRPGTEEPALATGFAEALRVLAPLRKKEAKRIEALRDELAKQLKTRYPNIVINGDLRRALPHMLNISVPGERTGEYLALRFDRLGVALSTKSACKEGEAASHVVASLVEAETRAGDVAAPSWKAVNTLRFSLGLATTRAAIRRMLKVAEAVFGVVART